jgi:hypothetical protein
VKYAIAFACVAACDDGAVRIEPVFDLPTDEDARPSGLDTLVLSISHAGSEQDLTSRSFKPGEQIELDEVAFDDALVVHLSGQVAGTPAAYGRTCTFAVTPDGPPPRPHLWFARSVRFASLDVVPREHAGGIAMEDAGGVVLVGGDDSTIERFDPMTGTLATLGQLVPRRGAVAARLGTPGAQRIAILGGDADGGFLDLVDPGDRAARVERIEDTRLARSALTATSLTDGRVIVVGGRSEGAVSDELLELTADGAATVIRVARAKLAFPRAEHTATRLGDDVGAPVLLVGGTGASNVVAVAELWKPLSGELANPATFAPAMVVPRRDHRAELMPDGSVLVIGGIDANGAPVHTLERFVIDAGFIVVGDLPPVAGVIDATTTRLPDGRILITGGRLTIDGPPVDTALIARLDVVNGSVDVVQTDRLAAARANHVAVPLCDGTVWISGGSASPLAERYNPPPIGRR